MNTLLFLRLLAVGGVTLLALLVVQMLIGYRKIKFEGPRQWKFHRWLAWLLVVAAVVHGTAGLTYVLGLW